MHVTVIFTEMLAAHDCELKIGILHDKIKRILNYSGSVI